MTDVITAQPITVPPNGGPNTLWFEEVTLGWSNVTQIVLVFPPGCSGLVGARIEFSVNPVYPINQGAWFTLDDYVLTIPVTGQGNSGQWRLTAYNQDNYPHTVTAYFYWDHLQAASSQQPSQLISL